MKPGKPLLIARRKEQWVLGLPGNPVSSYVTAFLFLLPLLRRLGGAEAALPTLFPMRTTVPLPPGGSRLELIRGRLANGLLTPLESC
jgi:molybdopterin molybdotransferase